MQYQLLLIFLASFIGCLSGAFTVYLIFNKSILKKTMKPLPDIEEITPTPTPLTPEIEPPKILADDPFFTILNKNGLMLNIKWESVKFEPYDDGLGIWTIGIGHVITKKDNFPNRPLTMEEVLSIFWIDTKRILITTKRLFKNTSGDKFAALFNFCYNLPPDSVEKSTLRKYLIGEKEYPREVNVESVTDRYKIGVYLNKERLAGIRVRVRETFDEGDFTIEQRVIAREFLKWVTGLHRESGERIFMFGLFNRRFDEALLFCESFTIPKRLKKIEITYPQIEISENPK